MLLAIFPVLFAFFCAIRIFPVLFAFFPCYSQFFPSAIRIFSMIFAFIPCYSQFFPRAIHNCGPGSVVGIATGYGLDDPGIESRWGAKFSAPVQTGPGGQPASCTMGTESFPGLKSGRGVKLTLTPSSAVVMKG